MWPSRADAHRGTDAYGYDDTLANAHAHDHGDTHGHPIAHANADGDRDGHAHGHGHCNGNANPDADPYAVAHADPDPAPARDLYADARVRATHGDASAGGPGAACPGDAAGERHARSEPDL